MVDIAGLVTGLKQHAIEHGFHVHDERHLVETYSLRQAWEVDLHPESGCGGPIDLHLSLDVDPNVILDLHDAIDALDDPDDDPSGEYVLDLYFHWAIPALANPPDLLVLATDLAGVAGPALAIEVSAIDSYEAVSIAPERRLNLQGKTQLDLVEVLSGREQMCEVLDRSRDVSEYLLDRVEGWLHAD